MFLVKATSARRTKSFGGPCTAVAAALVVALGGCDALFDRPVVTKEWSGLIPWTENDNSGVAGIEFAGVAVMGFERPNVGQTVVAVWADFFPDSCGGGGSGGPGEFKAKWDMEGAKHSKRLEFQLTFHRDDPGTLTLDDREYNLQDGTLFLVSLAKKRPVVKQLKRNLSGGQLTAPALKQLATSDSEIKNFFGAAKSK
jgi:hypothetical protein